GDRAGAINHAVPGHGAGDGQRPVDGELGAVGQDQGAAGGGRLADDQSAGLDGQLAGQLQAADGAARDVVNDVRADRNNRGVAGARGDAQGPVGAIAPETAGAFAGAGG